MLPKGFHKVRCYGLLSPRHRGKLHQLQLLLSTPEPPPAEESEAEQDQSDTQRPCPQCSVGIMAIITWIPRAPRGPP